MPDIKRKQTSSKKGKKPAKKIKNKNKNLDDFGSITDILNYKKFNQAGRLVLKNNRLAEIFTVRGRDLGYATSEQIDEYTSEFDEFNRSYIDGYQIFTLKFPQSTLAQRNYWEDKLKSVRNMATNDPTNPQYAARENQILLNIEVLNNVEELYPNEEYIFVLFGKDERDLENNISLFRKHSQIFEYEIPSQSKKTDILFKINNLNTTV